MVSTCRIERISFLRGDNYFLYNWTSGHLIGTPGYPITETVMNLNGLGLTVCATYDPPISSQQTGFPTNVRLK